MTDENIKKMLYNYPKLDKWIDECENELQQIRDRINIHYEVGTSVISDLPHGTGVSDNTLQAVERIDKLREIYLKRSNKLAIDIGYYYKQKELVEYFMPRLSYIQQDVIELRYFNRMAWKQIWTLIPDNGIDRTWYNEHRKMFPVINKLLEEKRKADN